MPGNHSDMIPLSHSATLNVQNEEPPDDPDNTSPSTRPKLWKRIKITDKASCLNTFLRLFALLIGIILLLVILYQAGVGPWNLTHVKVAHGPSKYANQTCWNTTSLNVFLPWTEHPPPKEPVCVPS
ncbi:hypothetical protein ILYODFUR_020434 [Ilyodon furcidens]|uniref:Uncharacterized protein n=1 Tax=Ilyodon furcidens TaxID=33524 RepID=A0ABV0U6Z8_9TELE